MKTPLKILATLMVASVGFYNLTITKATDSKMTLALTENSAAADPEIDAGAKVHDKSVTTTHVTQTITKPNGDICTRSYDLVRTICIGTGPISCKEDVPGTTSNEKTTC
ncbi:hypothetical protein [Pedobacter miscanthi]|uniref:Uncharacterized protein n=1 Tax=Pedobacter miscanthi TaxID=2259170 RepID=A0A366KME6_9SPHI|nr:hypothetical protein [Pedobacter miscanthi]RBQ02700.1 hypothetical protein DRW42_25485 [Pedobacter miscanthi]